MRRRKRLRFDGTSAGDSITGIPAPDDEWQLPVARKHQLHAHYRVEVGGKDGCSDDDDDVLDDELQEPLEPPQKKKRVTVAKKDDDEELTFFFQPARSLVEELIHLTQAKAIIDLTAGAGVWALAAMENNIAYFGMVLTTDVRLKELNNHLVRQVKAKLSDPTSKLYMSSLAGTVKAKPKGMPKPKGGIDQEKKDKKDKKGKKNKKDKKASSSSASSESDSRSPAA
jgi:hypothetical protein